MGFFSNLFSSLFKKPKTLQEQIMEEHSTEWYSSNKARDLLLEICMTWTEPAERKDILTLWLVGYFESLANIKELKIHEVTVSTWILAGEMTALFEREIEKYDTVAKQIFYGSKYIFDENTNPYLRFVKKLNHQFWGEGAQLISDLIYLNYIDVDRDEWLYDKVLFAIQDETEKGEKLSAKISEFLYEKGIVTDEIMIEVEELAS